MTATNFYLRGIPTDTMMMLKHEAAMQHTSVNLLILKLIELGIGYSQVLNKAVYHELDKFAGTWSKKDAQEFEKSMKDFE